MQELSQVLEERLYKLANKLEHYQSRSFKDLSYLEIEDFFCVEQEVIEIEEEFERLGGF